MSNEILNDRKTCDVCGFSYELNEPSIRVTVYPDSPKEELLGSFCIDCFNNGVMWAAKQAYKRK